MASATDPDRRDRDSILQSPVHSGPVTLSDTIELSRVTTAFILEADSTVKMTFRDGSVDTIPLLGKVQYSMQIRLFWLTGTTPGTVVHAQW
jgi:hypothetical protein